MEEDRNFLGSALCVTAVALGLLFAFEDHAERDAGFRRAMTPRNASGPGGTLDHAYNQRLNMQSTGVDDVQIPLEVRQAYAKEKGLRVPDR